MYDELGVGGQIPEWDSLNHDEKYTHVRCSPGTVSAVMTVWGCTWYML